MNDTSGLMWSAIIWLPLGVALVVLLRAGAAFLRQLQILFSSDATRTSSLLVSIGSARVLVALQLVLTPLALWRTWTHMLLMVSDDMAISKDDSFWHWFTTRKTHRPHSMLFEAYQLTSNKAGAGGWWWTSQLMFVVATYVVFMYVESSRHRHKQRVVAAAQKAAGGDTSAGTSAGGAMNHVWVFVWIGFMVALSVGLPLFMCSLVASSFSAPPAPAAPAEDRRKKTASTAVAATAPSQFSLLSASSIPSLALILMCVAVELFCSVLMPHLPVSTTDAPNPLFNRNLIAGHVVLLIPFVARGVVPFWRRITSSTPVVGRPSIVSSASVTAIYLLIAGAAFVQYVTTSIGMIQYTFKHFSLWAIELLPPSGVVGWGSFLSLAGVQTGAVAIGKWIRSWALILSHYMFTTNAQASVGWDVVFVTIEVLVWVICIGLGSQYRHYKARADESGAEASPPPPAAGARPIGYTRKVWFVVSLCVLCPVISVAVVFPLFLAWRELEYLRQHQSEVDSAPLKVVAAPAAEDDNGDDADADADDDASADSTSSGAHKHSD